MTRTASPNRERAKTAIDSALTRRNPQTGQTAALCAVAYALLEVAFQVGRVADNVPLFGPARER